MPERSPEATATVSEVIRKTIQRRGLTAYAVAKQAGCPIDPVARFIKRERGLSLDTADRIAAGLGLALVEAGGLRPLVLVGLSEVGRILGVSRFVSRRLHRDGELPQPIGHLDSNPLWDRAVIEHLAAERRHAGGTTVDG
jgi:hypothetical protein